MNRLFQVAVILCLTGGSIPASAQTYRFDCPTHCLHYCAKKELVPGLYRGNCQIACQRGCYRTRAERSAGHSF
jgi:hypothetical protein